MKNAGLIDLSSTWGTPGFSASIEGGPARNPNGEGLRLRDNTSRGAEFRGSWLSLAEISCRSVRGGSAPASNQGKKNLEICFPGFLVPRTHPDGPKIAARATGRRKQTREKNSPIWGPYGSDGLSSSPWAEDEGLSKAYATPVVERKGRATLWGARIWGAGWITRNGARERCGQS